MEMMKVSEEALLRVKNYFLDLQNRICLFLENEDGTKKFQEEKWEYPQGGGGSTRILQHGNHIEKAGVNFSHVHGKELPKSATEKRPELKGCAFQALGVSAVIHPVNPFVPTAHMNVRLIFLKENNAWLGGGFDLTPYYGFTEDCAHWHRTAKSACDSFGKEIYFKFKKNCDDYFYLKHRAEPRGIGGLFFDDLNEWEFEKSFSFIKSVGDHFILAYQPIFQKRKNHLFTEKNKEFQLMRRGRYVEFNLLYDRGTLFGLQSGGRTESILMSLPPSVKWEYDFQIEKGSEEEKLYSEFLVNKNWVEI